MNSSVTSPVSALQSVPKAQLARVARRELAKRHLLDFVTWATPTTQGKPTILPYHLPRLTQALELAIKEPQKGLFSTGPQLGKTFLVLHALVWGAWNVPESKSLYITYGSAPAADRANQAKEIAERAGLLASANSHEVRLTNGSVIWFRSLGESVESFAATLYFILDDPYKDPASVASAAERARVERWWEETARGRGHPTTTYIVCHHRWTVFDLIATLQARGWEWTNYPTLNEKDESIWPEFKPTSYFHDLRKSTLQSVWEGLYQGIPAPEGGRLFRGDHRQYDSPPRFNHRVAIGIDMGAGGKDYNAIVVVARQEDDYYVLEAHRNKDDAPRFFNLLRSVQNRYPAAPPARWYTSSGEVGIAKMFSAHGVRVESILAQTVGGKGARAMNCAAAWNANPDGGKPLGQYWVPASNPKWLQDFIREVLDFSPDEKQNEHDDLVDALVAAHDVLANKVSGPGMVSLPRLGSGWTF